VFDIATGSHSMSQIRRLLCKQQDGYTIFKQQFLDLGLQSKEMSTAVTFANLPENRRKNRYTNILPCR
jgi:hypothetical protein